MFSLSACLYLSAFLFSVGIYGVLARRNILVILMSLELTLNAVNLALVAFGRAHAVVGEPGEHPEVDVVAFRRHEVDRRVITKRSIVVPRRPPRLATAQKEAVARHGRLI